MARITIDDCTDKIESRFDLVLFASHKARLALEGVSLQADDSHAKKSEKTTVQALREIADGNVNPEELEESLISRMQNERSIQKLVEEPVADENLTAGDVEESFVQEVKKVESSASSPLAGIAPMNTSTISFDDDVLDDDAE